jgi:Astacin (Peptidase family M12A)
MKQNISILLFFIICSMPAFSQEGYSGIGEVTGSTDITIKNPISDEDIEVTIQFINGMAVLDGDIILGLASDYSRGRGGAVTNTPGSKWIGVIPYFISTGLPQSDIGKIRQAERILESQTNLRFSELTSFPAKGTDFIHFIVSPDNICASLGLGNRAGIDTIFIASGYAVGTFMHEILHKIGFLHEHNRSDRDTHITVHFNNITTKWKKQYQRIPNPKNTLLSNYDYESIMHYSSTGGNGMSVDASKPLITAISTNAAERTRLNALMGNRSHLSAGDILSINKLYPTAASGGVSGGTSSVPATAAGRASGGGAASHDNIPESIVDDASPTQSINYTFPGSNSPTQVTVNVLDNKAILDGDIILGTMEELSGSGGRGGAAIGATDGGVNRRWPNCTIPYDLNSHPCSTAIRIAIRTIDSLTNLTFIPKTSQTNYIQFVTGTGYSSPVGMQNGRANSITISSSGGCPTGKIIHETLHSAGLFHEQSRADRNTFVNINTGNLKEAMRHNFQTYLERGKTGSDVGPYDFESIMHYPSVIGDSRMVIDMTIPIITSVPPGKEGLMGQRSHLSAGDISAINTIYTCGAAVGGGTALTVSGDLTTGKEHTVPLVPQTANYSSFDACASMMISWIYPFLITSPAEISGQTGFWNQFVYNVDPTLPISFVQWGMQKIDPKQYTPSELFSIVNISPIVVVPIGTNPIRARLIYGMKGDGTPTGTVVMFHDALDRDKTQFSSPNNGYSQTLSFQEFMTLLGSNNIVVGKF